MSPRMRVIVISVCALFIVDTAVLFKGSVSGWFTLLLLAAAFLAALAVVSAVMNKERPTRILGGAAAVLTAISVFLS